MPLDTSIDYFRLNPETAAFCDAIWNDKYSQNEITRRESYTRISNGIFTPKHVKGSYRDSELLHKYLSERKACPAGRVMAGAGTNKNVTMWNCFVAPLVQDSMKTDPTKPGKGIMDALADVAYSMQMGGGVGTDFSTLRPEGAMVKRLNAPASGPLAFMDMWDAMCKTVMSAGYRRGAMMATLICHHPDIMKFIAAKHNPNRLRMFNLSVLITDDFMRAKENDDLWNLGHWEPPFGREPEGAMQKPDPWNNNKMRTWYVYEQIPARQIWDAIMQSNYDYAEPGTIFIDVINRMNNLYYCEYISCTNPCGEQPLPPNQNCNLSHLNVARMIKGTPFHSDCEVNYGEIEQVARLMTRMSDRVIDLSAVPTEEQHAEGQAKRRLGIGFTGLGNLHMFLRQRYGSPDAVATAGLIMRTITHSCYRESIELAKEYGPFPAFDRNKYLTGEFIKTLPEDIQQGIANYGIRNALLNTIAPVGTGSTAQCDNASSGLEPAFLPRYKRKVLQSDNSFKEYTVEDFGFRVYSNVFFDGDMDRALRDVVPDFMCTTEDLAPSDHLMTQAAVQEHIDASISKTINVPEDISFDDFKNIYHAAYGLGCKGCTTYRPNEASGRGSVLSPVDAPASAPEPEARAVSPGTLRERPEILDGRTYKLRWAGLPYPLFLTINDEILPDGSRLPFETFLNSKAVEQSHWSAALTRLVTSIMRKSHSVDDMAFLVEELKQIWSATGGEYKGQRYVPSEVSLIGEALERHFEWVGHSTLPADMNFTLPATIHNILVNVVDGGGGGRGLCKSCGSYSVIHKEGCSECTECGWSNCK